MLLQAMYFPWHFSRLKSRCNCYQGSDTATSSLPTARESLQKITNKTFTIWSGNANSHWYRNGRMHRAQEWEVTSFKLLSAGKRGSNTAANKHLITAFSTLLSAAFLSLRQPPAPSTSMWHPWMGLEPLRTSLKALDTFLKAWGSGTSLEM